MLLTLLLAAVPAWPAPLQAPVEGCHAAACTSQAEVKICKCVPEEGEKRPGIVIEGPGKRHLEWDVRSFLGEVSDFVVQTADLDNDGRPELLVASRASESNGMMVRDWELAIVDGESEGVMHLLVQDWGPDAITAQKMIEAAEESIRRSSVVKL